MEELDGKRTIVPDIPPNYVTILQLKERWLKKKGLKRKEEEDKEKRPWEQQVEEPGKIEGDLKKSVAIEEQEDLGEDLERNRYEENRLGRSGREHSGMYSKKKESMVGREASCAEKGEPEVMAVVREGSTNADLRDEKLPEIKKKQKKWKKKPNKTINQAVPVKDAVDFESSAPPPESLRTKITPVKKEFQFHRPKRENAMGKISVGSGEKTFTDATALDMQLEDLMINRGDEREQTRNMNAPFRSSHGRRNWPDQRHHLPFQRGTIPRAAAGTMVWVKKEHNEGAGSGSGSGSDVKPLTS